MGNIVLSNQHEEFATEFLYGKYKGNAGRCYAEVYHGGGMTPSCYSHGSRLIGREDVAQFLQLKKEEHFKVSEFTKISNDRILSDIIHECATYKPTDINGTELSPHLVRGTALKAIEIQSKMHGHFEEKKSTLNVEGNASFVFNLVVPTDEGEEDKILDITHENLDNETEDF